MPKLLCVDDEPFILSALQRLFRGQYEVFTATSGAAALQLLAKTPVEVVISDQRMPGTTGIELLAKVREMAPETMRILLTGYADLPATLAAVNSGEVYRYVTKPWNNDYLRRVVKGAMEAAQGTAGIVQMLHRAPATPEPFKAAILVLDSDAGLCQMVREQAGATRRVLEATDLNSAADFLENDPQVGVLVCEATLGKQDLSELLSTLKAVRPTLAVIVASNLVDAQLIIRLINQGQIYRYIAKPVDPIKLHSEIQGAARRHHFLASQPTLQTRHHVETSQAVSTAVAQHQASSGGLRNLLARVGAFFRH